MLDRRELLTITAAGGALAAGCKITRVGDQPPADEADDAPLDTSFELEEWTVARLQAAMESGELTAEGITQKYLARIAALDASGPRVNSVIEVNPEALAIAATLDRERADSGARGPLHGIPVLIKDNIDTADRMETTAGSLALAEGARPARDAFVVERLRAAGAILLGKANLSEWANFRSERSSSGWSGRGGQTKNPYVLDRNPCGSSSGSGAAAAANFCALAIGTETDGSVVCPANANGLVGVKPTIGLVSRSGIVPIAHSQDTAGPMARTVTDAAHLLTAMVGADPRDGVTAAATANGQSDYAQFLEPDLGGLRVGVWRERFGFHEGVDAVLEEGLAALREAGAEVVDPIEMPSIGEIGRSEYTVLLYEFKADLELYLQDRGHELSTLADLIAYNEEHADREMPFFRQEIFDKAVAKGPLTEPEYVEALETCRRLSRTEGIDRVLAEHRLDAIAAPTGGPAWTTDLVNGDHFGGSCSTAAAVSGYAHVTVPAGLVHGLPIGLSFFAGAFSEPTLLRLAYGFEQATTARTAPRFSPTLGYPQT